MPRHYYVYHALIANRNTVRGEKLSPNYELLGTTHGALNYKDPLKARILELGRAVKNSEVNALQVRELGAELFAALFDPVLSRDFFDFYERVRDEQALLRLELDIDERELPDIAALPWEFMHVPPEAGYGVAWLSTDPYIVFSRRRARWRVPKPIGLAHAERLKIALAIAAPDGLGPVKYQRVQETLEELANRPESGVELLKPVNPATPVTIDEALEHRPHILHFIGHGRFKDAQGNRVGQIALRDVTGQPDWKSAEDFGELLRRYRPSIVLLQACEGAVLSTAEAFVGVASQVIEQNVPVVVAMQYEISNSSACKFALEFYKRLANRDPVDKAVQEGRRQIALGPLDYSTRDFATPVLFMGVRDGHLFQPTTVDSSTGDMVSKDSDVEDVETRLRFLQVKRKALEKRLAESMEEYEAVMTQMGYALNNVDRKKLQRQANALESEIQQVEKELNEL